MQAAAPTQNRAEAGARVSLAQAIGHIRQLLNERRFEPAQALCTSILGQIPDEPNVLKLLGMVSFAQGRSDQALQIFTRLTELQPAQAGTWTDLANVQIEAEQFDAASATLRRAIELDPSSVVSWNSLAVLGLRAGRYNDADSALQSGLKLAPHDGQLQYHQGLVRQQQGRLQEAVGWLEQAVVADPQDPRRRLSLAQVLLDLKRFDQVAAVCRGLLTLGHSTEVVYNKLGVALMQLSRLEDSEAALRAGLAIDADNRDLHYNLARLLFRSRRFEEAIACAAVVLRDEPSLVPIREMVTSCHLALGNRAAAVANLQQWKVFDPDSARPDHLLAGLGEAVMPERASDDYVRDVFDNFAETFDQNLQALDYKAPEFVQQALESVAARLPERLQMLDAGCGTGLCGHFLKTYRGTLVGVDLSQGMLDKAAARAEYDQLERAELTAFLRRSQLMFDVIVSADTLCYFGALEDVLSAARSALKDGGILIFSLEASADETRPFVLHAHGRYSHSQAYVRQVLQHSGLENLAIEERILRKENNLPVHGWIVTAQRAQVD